MSQKEDKQEKLRCISECVFVCLRSPLNADGELVWAENHGFQILRPQSHKAAGSFGGAAQGVCLVLAASWGPFSLPPGIGSVFQGNRRSLSSRLEFVLLPAEVLKVCLSSTVRNCSLPVCTADLFLRHVPETSSLPGNRLLGAWILDRSECVLILGRSSRRPGPGSGTA